MGSLKGLKTGDEVYLVTRYGGRREKDQTPLTVTIHKVGRTLVHVLRYPERLDLGTETYRIEDGVRNDNYGHSYLITREEYEARKIQSELLEELRKLGVRFDHGRTPESPSVLRAMIAALGWQ